MLVDDDRDIAQMYAFALAQAGFRIEVLTNAAAFFRALEREIPDAVVLDWELPTISGGEILRLLRRDPRTEDVPVVFLSNHARDDVSVLPGGAETLWLLKSRTTPAQLARQLHVLMRVEPAAG
jgi:two-component system phosphate regulon response regulator PhoB